MIKTRSCVGDVGNESDRVKSARRHVLGWSLAKFRLVTTSQREFNPKFVLDIGTYFGITLVAAEKQLELRSPPDCAF